MKSRYYEQREALKKLFNKADDLANKATKKRNNYACRYCSSNKKGLHWSHVFTRDIKTIRWNPLNNVTLCSEHHKYFDHNKEEFREWWKSEIGEKNFEELIRLKNNPVKISKEFLVEVIKILTIGSEK